MSTHPDGNKSAEGHVPAGGQAALTAIRLAIFHLSGLKPSRDVSVTSTKLDEAMMWLNRALESGSA
jgi:hypothetical protein